MISLNDTARILREHDNFIILTHDSPDGDTLGSAYALSGILMQLQKKSKVTVCGDMPLKYKYLADDVEDLDFTPQYTVSVDIAADSLLGALSKNYAGKIDLCIDHHGSNNLTAENIYVDSSAAATTEIIYELARILGVEINKQIADCIFTGLTTDTGCFRFSNTTARTHRVAADMIEAGCDATYINRVMFDTKSRARLEVERLAIETMEFFANRRCAIIYTTLAMVAAAGATEADLEGIASIPRQVEGVCVGVTMREQEDCSFKISVRTSDGVDASEICAVFGGGGHPGAGGCIIKGTLEDVKSKLAAAVGKILS